MRTIDNEPDEAMKYARSRHRNRPKARYSEQQIREFLRRIDAGEEKSVADACRTFGVSRQAYYVWRTKYCRMLRHEAEVSKLRVEIGEIRRRLERQDYIFALFQSLLTTWGSDSPTLDEPVVLALDGERAELSPRL